MRLKGGNRVRVNMQLETPCTRRDVLTVKEGLGLGLIFRLDGHALSRAFPVRVSELS
jgi:hypothetical protein